jgi:hypothetical protein
MHCSQCGKKFNWKWSEEPVSENFEDLNLELCTKNYKSMKISLWLEQKLLNPVEGAPDWVTCEFIKEAAKVLFKNRRVLMYSFVFAYYIDANHLKKMFELNLENLRHATEELSGMLERDVNKNTIHIMEPAVEDKFRFCDTRRKIMVNFVRDGYDNNYWKERLVAQSGSDDIYAAPRIKPKILENF